LSGVPILSTNIRLGWRRPSVLLYCATKLIMAIKGFIVQFPGCLTSGACTIKLFTPVIYGFSLKARMFVSGKPFQTSLMFVGTLEWSTLKVLHSGWLPPYPQTLDKAEKACRDKHSSLLRKSVNYGCKMFYNTGSWRLMFQWPNKQVVNNLDTFMLF